MSHDPLPLGLRNVVFREYHGTRTREAKVIDEPPLYLFEEEEGPFGAHLEEVGRATAMEMVLLGHVNAQRYTTLQVWARSPPPPLARGHVIPIDDTYCRQEITSDEPFVMGDARTHPHFREHPGYLRHGLRSYVGAPLWLPDGTLLGTLCAVGTQPHWPSLASVERLVHVSEDVAREMGRRLDLC